LAGNAWGEPKASYRGSWQESVEDDVGQRVGDLGEVVIPCRFRSAEVACQRCLCEACDRATTAKYSRCMGIGASRLVATRRSTLGATLARVGAT
jgi:hypothetical protein